MQRLYGGGVQVLTYLSALLLIYGQCGLEPQCPLGYLTSKAYNFQLSISVPEPVEGSIFNFQLYQLYLQFAFTRISESSNIKITVH